MAPAGLITVRIEWTVNVRDLEFRTLSVILGIFTL